MCYTDHAGQVFVERMHFDAEGGIFFESISMAKVYPPTIIKSLCIFSNSVALVTDNNLKSFNYTMAPVACARNGQRLPFYNALIERYWTFRNEIVFATSK